MEWVHIKEKWKVSNYRLVILFTYRYVVGIRGHLVTFSGIANHDMCVIVLTELSLVLMTDWRSSVVVRRCNIYKFVSG